jgi:ArsR family transcriptional regulator, arsenate/arsenite/antimonite-responsive transcriptional repressor / arsenate reductase (thioredoxin)
MAPTTLRPPQSLLLVGHPIRWRLLTELAHGDRRVGELVGSTGQSQGLVSYHLGRLRAQRVVSTRRSSADGRDMYYSLDLARCAGLLAGAGSALHPSLALAPPPSPSPGARVSVLFLCTGNSARSQMAEALLEHVAGGWADASSAGSHPRPLHAHAVRAMRERGIDISGRRSKPIGELADRHFDCVVSVCDRVRERCPELLGRPESMHWSIADPAAGDGSYAAFQRTASELETRIGHLLHALHSRR